MLILHYFAPNTLSTKYFKNNLKRLAEKSKDFQIIGAPAQWQGLQTEVLNYLNFLGVSDNICKGISTFDNSLFVLDGFEVMRNFNAEARYIFVNAIRILAQNNTVHIASNELQVLLNCAPAEKADKFYCHYTDKKNNKTNYYHKPFNSSQFLEFTGFAQGYRI